MPRSLREAAYALGATKLDVTVKVVVPAAISGIVAAFLLALVAGDRRDDGGGARRRQSAAI